MADAFDPYQKWLGIPPEEQPPNHYRLLGIPVLSSDSDMIANTADQRMIYLRTFNTSAQRNLSEKLLCEVAAARVCLLDPVRKAAYDSELRQSQEQTVAPLVSPDLKNVKRPPPRPTPAQPVTEKPPRSVDDATLISIEQRPERSLGRSNRQARPGLGPGLMILLGVGALILIGGVLIFFALSSGEKTGVVAHGQGNQPARVQDGPKAADQPDIGRAVADRPPTSNDPKEQVKPPSPNVEKETVLPIDKPSTVPGAPVSPTVPSKPELSVTERIELKKGELQRALTVDNLARAMALTRELAELEGGNAIRHQAHTLTLYDKTASSAASLTAIIKEASALVPAAMAARQPDVARTCAVLALVAARRLDQPDSIRDATYLVLEARKLNAE